MSSFSMFRADSDVDYFFTNFIMQTGLILVPDVVTTVVNLMTAFGLLAVCSLVHSCVAHECKCIQSFI